MWVKFCEWNSIKLPYTRQAWSYFRACHSWSSSKPSQSSQVILDSIVKQGKPPLVTCGLSLIKSANQKYVSRHDVLYLLVPLGGRYFTLSYRNPTNLSPFCRTIQQLYSTLWTCNYRVIIVTPGLHNQIQYKQIMESHFICRLFECRLFLCRPTGYLSWCSHRQLLVIRAELTEG